MTGKIVSFEDLKKSRRLDVEFEFDVEPYELGLTPEDLGVQPGEKVTMKFRPLSTSELGQILLKTKDIEAPFYAPARDEMIVQTCLTEPKIPDGVAGNAMLQTWMPGTVAILSQQAQNKAGYSEHVVRNATAELGN